MIATTTGKPVTNERIPLLIQEVAGLRERQ